MAPVLALAAIMKGSTDPVTAAGIKTQTETAKNVEIPLSGGLTFTYNGTAIPLLKSVCCRRRPSVSSRVGRPARSPTSRSTTRRRCSSQSLCPLRGRHVIVKMVLGARDAGCSLTLEAVSQSGAGARPDGSRTVP